MRANKISTIAPIVEVMKIPNQVEENPIFKRLSNHGPTYPPKIPRMMFINNPLLVDFINILAAHPANAPINNDTRIPIVSFLVIKGQYTKKN